jgi:hypothetical protein
MFQENDGTWQVAALLVQQSCAAHREDGNCGQ